MLQVLLSSRAQACLNVPADAAQLDCQIGDFNTRAAMCRVKRMLKLNIREKTVDQVLLVSNSQRQIL